MYDNFVYDGTRLSDTGFIVCNITQDFMQIKQGSAPLTFNRIRYNRGKKYTLESSTYNTTYTDTIEICKNPNDYEDIIISDSEFRQMVQWLNREDFHPLWFYKRGQPAEVIYNASFNIQKITAGNKIIGIKLKMNTDSPLGHGRQITQRLKVRDASKIFIVNAVNDEYGIICPDMIIKPLKNGDLTIDNLSYDERLEIKDCYVGETITLTSGAVIDTNGSIDRQRKIGDAFNWNFLKLHKSVDNFQNKLKFNMPCDCTITYTPQIKF